MQAITRRMNQKVIMKHIKTPPEGPGALILSAYGFLAFPLAAAFIALQVIVPTHYAEATAMSLSTIGAIMLVARLWDTVTDPLIGFLSDKTPQRLGRRRIWIVVSVPLICISAYALFNPSGDSDKSYLLVWTLAIYIAGTMAIIPMDAWGAELSPDYHQRNKVTGTRAAFGLAGTIAALLITAMTGQAGSEALTNALFFITLLVMCTFTIAVILLFWVPDNTPTHLPSNQIRDGIKLIVTPSPYRTLLVGFLFNSAGNAIPATLFLFYVSYFLQVPEKAGMLLFMYFLFAAFSVPFWVWLAKKVGKHKTWRWSILTACLLFAWTPFLNPGDIVIYTIIVLATGFTTGCDLMIPTSMNGDLVEWDAAKNGYRRPGLLFAIWGTTTKLSFALAIGIAFPLLDLFGFTAGPGNSTQALAALGFMYGLPCIFLKLLALYRMRGYEITESRYEQLRKRNKNISKFAQ
jgi:GPH family glycoside/pentoside/hexuronide:cation symporter